MAEVEVRQWSDHVFAAYVFDGDPYGTFVGTESTRDVARELGESRCGTTVAAGVPDVSETERMGELGCARRERANARTGGRLEPLTSPGA